MQTVSISIKAVPGASSDRVVGMLGDRLKVRVAAAPEGGKANKAICVLIARSLGIKAGMVEVRSGLSNAEKVVCITGSGFSCAQEVLDRLCSES